MSATRASSILLDRDIAAFIQSGIPASVASRSAANEPSVVRGIGCRVSADRRSVSVFVVAAHAAPVLADIRLTGQVAAVFSQPTTHRTIQLKGADASVRALGRGDRQLLEAQHALLVAELGRLGYPHTFARALFAAGPGEVVAVRFHPVAAFAQTPGPHAGERLGK